MTEPKLTIGTNLCQCPACGEYFTTVANFDMHRETVSKNPYRRVCRNPGSVVNKHGKARLRRNAKGFWSNAEGTYIPRST